MKRIIFYLLKTLSILCKAFSHKLYMRLIVKVHKINGVNIIGMPAFIDFSAHIDPSGGLTINEGAVVSINAIILTHDWSFLSRYKARNITPETKYNNLTIKHINPYLSTNTHSSGPEQLSSLAVKSGNTALSVQVLS